MSLPTVRPTAVAGSFYPGDPNKLELQLEQLLSEAQVKAVWSDRRLRGLILPHAGYMFSGPVAAIGYKLLAQQAKNFKCILLLGPSHRVPLRGIALPNHSHFRTPLGDIPLDTDALKFLQRFDTVHVLPAAHALEHSLEVHLPFLQQVMGEFLLIPIVVGEMPAATLAAVIDKLWDEDTLLLISSDLSHYLPYKEATTQDQQTSELIEQCETNLNGEQACGCNPINGTLKLVSKRKLKVEILDYRNSGDTAGSKDQVVGYGAYAIF